MFRRIKRNKDILIGAMVVGAVITKLPYVSGPVNSILDNIMPAVGSGSSDNSSNDDGQVWA